MKKYELTNETLTHFGHTLYRIRALKDFGTVKSGDLGGFIESENNLSQEGLCWVADNAKVFEYAQITDNALVKGKARVRGAARVLSNAQVCDYARVLSNAQVSDNAKVSDNAYVYGNAWVYQNALVSDKAHIADNARVFGKALVFGHALVCGDAWLNNHALVHGDACVAGRASIEYPPHVLWLSHVGVEQSTLTAYRTREGTVELNYDSFRGTVDELLQQWVHQHNSRVQHEYRLLCELITVHFKGDENA